MDNCKNLHIPGSFLLWSNSPSICNIVKFISIVSSEKLYLYICINLHTHPFPQKTPKQNMYVFSPHPWIATLLGSRCDFAGAPEASCTIGGGEICAERVHLFHVSVWMCDCFCLMCVFIFGSRSTGNHVSLRSPPVLSRNPLHGICMLEMLCSLTTCFI